jgi:hypothetical protein
MDVDGNLVSGISLNLNAIKFNERTDIAQKAFPNPFRTIFTLEYYLPQNGSVNAIITDQFGHQVIETESVFKYAGIQQSEIDGSSLLPGIYHYRISFDGSNPQMITGTVIKSK